jgi:hypothetical protein
MFPPKKKRVSEKLLTIIMYRIDRYPGLTREDFYGQLPQITGAETDWIVG